MSGDAAALAVATAGIAHHGNQGALSLTDGSVQLLSTAGLQTALAQATNALGSFFTVMMLPQ